MYVVPDNGKARKPGILTERRQPPHSGVVPRRPPQRIHVARPGNDLAWDEVVKGAHRRWDVRSGVKVRQAEARAVDAREGDALDALVNIQVQHQRVLAERHRVPACVSRLHDNKGKMPPPVLLNPLDAFAEFARARNDDAPLAHADPSRHRHDHAQHGRYGAKANQPHKPSLGTKLVWDRANGRVRPD